MTGTNEERIDAGSLAAWAAAVFEGCGMGHDDAALLADSLVAADLDGTQSHGVLRVPEYVRKLTTGGVNPKGRPFLARDSGACMVVDGDNSMGQIGARFAMERVIERAATTGIAAAAIRGSNHCGAMAYFVLPAIARDMIGVATTHALPTMPPWGGAERLLGINPIAFGIPAGEEPPLIYDAAFSGSAHGKIRIYRQKGLRIPEGWALDRDGRPTTDPAEAVAGMLLPIGEFKGAALAMIMGVLSSMLSGAAYGTELGTMETGVTAGRDGHFVMALRVAAFEEIDTFKARVDAAIRQIHACKKAPGFDRIYAPGEKEYLNRAERLRTGIPLNAETWADLRRVAEERSVPVPP